MDAWEAGCVDGWHEGVAMAPSRRIHERAELNRYIWAGQARVLLPWIEIKRDCLEIALRTALGPERFTQCLRDFATSDFDPASSDSVAEIGLLNAVVRARIGKDDPQLRDAAEALWMARNQLAHLRPIAPGGLERLVRLCKALRG